MSWVSISVNELLNSEKKYFLTQILHVKFQINGFRDEIQGFYGCLMADSRIRQYFACTYGINNFNKLNLTIRIWLLQEKKLQPLEAPFVIKSITASISLAQKFARKKLYAFKNIYNIIAFTHTQFE